jgi:hypothetical protein
MIYLLVMQLKDRVSPNEVITLLFLGLVAPLTVAAMQLFLPHSILPEILSSKSGGDGTRLSGTLGHSNTFVTFLLLFISLTCWKIKQGSYSWRWIPDCLTHFRT